VVSTLPVEGTQERACPTCGARDARLRAGARLDADSLDEYAFASRKTPELMHHRLVTCARCSTVYASPAPSAAELGDAYRSAAYDSSEESRYAAVTYARALRRELGDLASFGPVLDIGAGDGAFLGELKAAGVAPLVGVEPSEAPIAAATPDVRPLLRRGLFDASDFEPGSFGLITCFQTIEHVPDPQQLCAGVRTLLPPGGALAIVCHDYRALVNRIMGTRSPIYDLEHMQLFSRGPIRELLERSGFTVTTVRRLINTYPLRYWVRLAPIPAGAKGSLLSRLGGRVGSIGMPLLVGNLLAVGRRA
jgi:SAM-dependent methyltransferase